MTKGNRSATDVHFRHIRFKFLFPGPYNRSKCFIDFDGIHLIQCQSGLCQYFPRCRDNTCQHHDRVFSDNRTCDILARGLTLKAFAFSPDISKRPAAPSLTWLELPAVTTPSSGWKDGVSPANFSIDVSRLIPSSYRNVSFPFSVSTSIGKISRSNL